MDANPTIENNGDFSSTFHHLFDSNGGLMKILATYVGSHVFEFTSSYPLSKVIIHLAKRGWCEIRSSLRVV